MELSNAITSSVNRETKETNIKLTLSLYGQGISKIDTGVGFLDHMLELFAKHSKFNLSVSCKGDTNVDDHHSVEDIGICLGQAFKECLGSKKGIKRYGDIILPMDEALILAAVDISGRCYLGYGLNNLKEKVGSFDTELVKEFFIAFVNNAGITLHIQQMAGENTHHIIEGTFKAVARALREATMIDEQFKDEIPSSKGVL